MFQAQLFQYFGNDIWFYVGFDVLHQISIKYLMAYPFADGKAEFLYTTTPVLEECLLCIWKYFHGAVTDVDKVD